MSTQTPTLDVILGAEESFPKFGEINEDIGWLLKQLRDDDDPTFLLTAQTKGRTKHSFPAAAALSEYMLRESLHTDKVNRHDLYLLFLIVLFILILDDHIDITFLAEERTVDHVRQFTEALYEACDTGDRDHDDLIIRYAARLTERLRSYEVFDLYSGLYFHELKRMLRGMVREYALSIPPSKRASLELRETDLALEGYMEDAFHTSGAALGLLACLAFLGDREIAERREPLRVALEIIGTIVRYTNDIKTFGRELREGKFVSALGLTAQKFGIELKRIGEALHENDIARLIRAMIVTEVYDLKDCLRYVDPDGDFEKIVHYTANAMVMLYIELDSDFHSFVLYSASGTPRLPDDAGT